MGKFTSSGNDVADSVNFGQLSAVGASPWISIDGRFNLFVTGAFTGSCQIERSFDAGETILPVTNADGTVRTFAGPDAVLVDEPERGMAYRIHCTELTAGAIDWRFSK
jgi:hypothetical protein